MYFLLPISVSHGRTRWIQGHGYWRIAHPIIYSWLGSYVQSRAECIERNLYIMLNVGFRIFGTLWHMFATSFLVISPVVTTMSNSVMRFSAPSKVGPIHWRLYTYDDDTSTGFTCRLYSRVQRVLRSRRIRTDSASSPSLRSQGSRA